MRSVIEDIAGYIEGAVEYERAADYLKLHRTSAATRDSVRSARFDHVSATPSGARLRMLTDAEYIELDVHLARMLLPGQSLAPSWFDVMVDGKPGPSAEMLPQSALSVDFSTGTPDAANLPTDTVRLDLDAAERPRVVEVWLPNSAETWVRDIRIPSSATIAHAPACGISWVHYGSSISQGAEAGHPLATWPARLADTAGYRLTNMGLSGECHLDQGIARTIGESDAQLICLEVGMNIVSGDSMRERAFVSAFNAFLDTIRRQKPSTPVVVMSPTYCAQVEDAPGPLAYEAGAVKAITRPAALAAGALTLTRVRQLLAECVDDRSRRDAQIHYIDGLTLLGAEDAGDLPDGIHPNAEGCRKIAERAQATVLGQVAVGAVG